MLSALSDRSSLVGLSSIIDTGLPPSTTNASLVQRLLSQRDQSNEENEEEEQGPSNGDEQMLDAWSLMDEVNARERERMSGQDEDGQMAEGSSRRKNGSAPSQRPSADRNRTPSTSSSSSRRASNTSHTAELTSLIKDIMEKPEDPVFTAMMEASIEAKRKDSDLREREMKMAEERWDFEKRQQQFESKQQDIQYKMMCARSLKELLDLGWDKQAALNFLGAETWEEQQAREEARKARREEEREEE